MNANAFRTHSGVLLDLSRPEEADVRLVDIAHHLARVCRFGGAVDRFYSVASHSVYVSNILAAQTQPTGLALPALAGLLHDATEAYLGDMVSGLKRMFPEYKSLERRWEARIAEVFGVQLSHPAIKSADLRARLSEARDLFTNYPRHLLLGVGGEHEAWPTRCVEESPLDAEWRFLDCAGRLGLAP